MSAERDALFLLSIAGSRTGIRLLHILVPTLVTLKGVSVLFTNKLCLGSFISMHDLEMQNKTGV